MKIKWLVQDVGINVQNIHANFDTLIRFGFPYSNFGVIAFTKTISNLKNILNDPEEQFIIRGGTKILTLLEQINSLQEVNQFLSEEQLSFSEQYIHNLKNGVFYHEQSFDQAYYGQLDLPLLNKGANYYPIKDHLQLSFKDNMFLKPSKDQKAFNAGVLEAGETIESFIINQAYQKSYLDEIAVIAPCRAISSEYRFFVVDKEVITGSRYRLAGQGNLSEIIPNNILEAAKEYAKLYQPHDVFTMDLAETPEGIFIVEYNCWNASGLYKTDVAKIFHVVQEYKEGLMQQKKLSFGK